MTYSDALYILRAVSPAALFPGAVVREPEETGSDADLADVEEAARLLGLDIAEDSDGAWIVGDSAGQPCAHSIFAPPT